MNRFLISEIGSDKDRAPDTGFLLEARSTTRIGRTPSVSASQPTLIQSTTPSPISKLEQSPSQQQVQQQTITVTPSSVRTAPKVPSQSLGQAFLVIFQATRSTIRKALLALDTDNVLSKSLQTLVDYVQYAEQDTPLAVIRSAEILRPFLDKIMKKSDENAKKISFLLLDWQLLDHPCRSIIIQGLALEMGPKTEDKKRKLSALLALEHALSTRHKRMLENDKEEPRTAMEKPPKESDKSKNSVNFLDIPETRGERGKGSAIEIIEPKEDLTAGTKGQELKKSMKTGEDMCAPFDGPILANLISHLSHITRHDGAVASDGISSMTRLTGLAFQLAISLSQTLTKGALREIELEEEEEERIKKSSVTQTIPRRGPLIIELDSDSIETPSLPDNAKDQSSLRWSFAKCMGCIRGVTEDLKMWNRNKSSLMKAALDDTLDMLSRFHRHYQRQFEEADIEIARATMIGNSPPKPPPFREIVKSFAKCWAPISAALYPTEAGILSSPSVLRRRVRETVDQKELPPFVRLHVIGLLLGQADPAVSADSLKPIAANDKLKAEIFEMADLVIKSGVPVARNVAIEIGKQLTGKESQGIETKPKPGNLSATAPVQQSSLPLSSTAQLPHPYNKERPAPTIAMVD
ncbi:hypothetical protein EMPS_10798 [Entomortierella parvispora]|uniref:Uncharacterized protein n=1 Tax=Entomortierella parvispora TaxID=205924 RepID=A0A9P3HKG3_9FUNG|nr:hypothetical protein EMPS_10798 [Entomortierella parvispora]